MLALHFICPEGLNHKQLGQLLFESGYWVVSDERAKEAEGGRIYLHERQDGPAWHGGDIVDWRAEKGKKVFVYRLVKDFAVRCRAGWGQEQATVRT